MLGIGRGNFKTYTSKLIAHNSAIEVGGEMGLVGLFIWFSMVYFSIKSVLQASAATTDPQDKDFYFALILAVIGYLTSAMFVTLEYETWYLLLAACAAVGRYAPTPMPVERRDLKIIGATLVGFVVVVQIFAILYLG